MKRLFKTLLIGAVALTPLAAYAAIDSTHHDMPYYTEDATDKKCAFCHSVTVSGLAAGAGMGTVGNFCYIVCHDGGNATVGNLLVPDAPGYINPDNLSTTAGLSGATVLTGSHGLDPTELATQSAGLDLASDVTGTYWPHSGEALMQCTTCHAVHDAQNAPFLNAPLYTGDNTTAFCNKCHTGAGAAGTAGRWQNIADLGAHPTEFAMSVTGTVADAGPVANAAAKNNRAIQFKAGLVSVLSTAGDGLSTTPADVTATLLSGAVDSWRPGGHIMDTTNIVPTGTANIDGAGFGCYSCHSAHQNNAAVGTTLLVGAMADARATVAGDSSVLCISCHVAGAAAAGTIYWNAGTTAYGHPANAGAGLPYEHDHADHGDVHPNIPDSGTFPIDVSATLATDITGLTALTTVGANGEIMCVTCHDVHGGVTGKMAIRDISNAGGVSSTTSDICYVCHGTASTEGLGGDVNRHHPSVTLAEFDTADYPGALTWGNGATLADGLGCADCHQFNDTAHNW